MKLLETIFEIWEKDAYSFLNNVPYLVMRHFLQRGNSNALLRKFLLLAPPEWLGDYWTELDDIFNLEGKFINRLGASVEDRKIRNKVNSLSRY